MQRAPTLAPEEDRGFYPIHEEDHVVQGPAHYRQSVYLTSVLAAHRPDLWGLGDACLYWVPGDNQRYVAPDVAVIGSPPPEPLPTVYLQWQDPPLLFVAEVASESTRGQDVAAKLSTYEQGLQAPEYLYADPDRQDLRLWRLVEGRYRRVRADPDGKLWSAQLGLWFGLDESGFLRVYTPERGMLLTHAEETMRAEREATLRTKAEERAEREAALRAEAERRLAEALAELERLRGPDTAPD